MVAQDEIPQQLSAIGGWLQRFEELYDRIAGQFARSEARHRVKHYLLGLLGTVERKNGWQLTVEDVPRTLNGKKLEVPVKKILSGKPLEEAASRDSLANLRVLESFAQFAVGN